MVRTKPSWERRIHPVKAKHILRCLDITQPPPPANATFTDSQRITFAGYWTHRHTCHGPVGDARHLLNSVVGVKWALMKGKNAPFYRLLVRKHKQLCLDEHLTRLHMRDLAMSVGLAEDTPLGMISDWIDECKVLSDGHIYQEWATPDGKVIHLVQPRVWCIKIFQLLWKLEDVH
jgi:hypothetical protein